jgi:hypothetical protein
VKFQYIQLYDASFSTYERFANHLIIFYTSRWRPLLEIRKTLDIPWILEKFYYDTHWTTGIEIYDKIKIVQRTLCEYIVPLVRFSRAKWKSYAWCDSVQ